MKPLDILTRAIPASVAATLLGVPPRTFDNMRDLTLISAWRLVLRDLRGQLHAVRARKRRPLRQAIAAQHRARAIHLPADAAAMAVEAFAARLADELDQLAADLREIDPRASARVHRSAATIRAAGVTEAAGLRLSVNPDAGA